MSGQDADYEGGTHRIEETAIVDDAAKFRMWAEEVLREFENQAEYPESISLIVEWEDDDE